MASRALVDTSILISLYNKGSFTDRFLDLNRRFDIIFSVVAINEFIRGSHDPVSKNIVKDFLDIVEGGLVVPTLDHWIECGRISEALLKGRRRSKESVLLLQNDILIGLCARERDATLMTCDRKDFEILKDLIRIPVEFW